MKILMVTPEFPPSCGGIGYYVFYLTRELLARGAHVRVILRRKRTEWVNYKGVEAEGLATPGIPPFNNGVFRKMIETKAASWGADLIHLHASSMPIPNCAQALVATSHSCIGAITPLFYRPIRDAESIYRNLLLPLYFKVERRLASSCDTLTVVSRSMAVDYKRLYGVGAEVVWNGVDLDHFRPLGSPPATPHVVFIGGLKRGKGLLDLIEAASIIRRHHSDISFDIFGRGPLRITLEKTAARNNLSNLHLHGSVTHDALPQVLSSASLVILPSYYEGLPTTLLEAMACGIPAVATAVKGNAELIRDGVTGYLAPPHDPTALAKAICKILDAPDQARAMGLAGRQLVEQKFTWGQRAEQFLEVYERALTRASCRSA